LQYALHWKDQSNLIRSIPEINAINYNFLIYSIVQINVDNKLIASVNAGECQVELQVALETSSEVNNDSNKQSQALRLDKSGSNDIFKH
jgi:hypothetical protein